MPHRHRLLHKIPSTCYPYLQLLHIKHPSESVCKTESFDSFFVHEMTQWDSLWGFLSNNQTNFSLCIGANLKATLCELRGNTAKFYHQIWYNLFRNSVCMIVGRHLLFKLHQNELFWNWNIVSGSFLGAGHVLYLCLTRIKCNVKWIIFWIWQNLCQHKEAYKIATLKNCQAVQNSAMANK